MHARGAIVLAAAALAAGGMACVESETTPCADGIVCPPDMVCSERAQRCVFPEQEDVCATSADGDACSFTGVPQGNCRDGVCVATECGNELVEAGEVCDDGNTTSGDGCSGDCKSRERCGDGVIDPRLDEDCDCGDGTEPAPGECSGPNSEEPGATCRSDCTLAGCGDSILDPDEECEGDDVAGMTCADILPYDGPLSCSSFCRFDLSACESCGDGVRNGPEQCDGLDLGGVDCTLFDYYDAAGLGCTSECVFDTAACTGQCGDGVVNGPEECDDTDVAGLDCTDFGYYDAPGLGCDTRCAFATTGCTGFCGDGIVNGPEFCEGAGPLTSCLDFGFDLGMPACTTLCTPEFDPCEHLGWTFESINREAIRDAIAFARDDVFVVGDNGMAFHWDGSVWTPHPVGTTTRLSGVWGTSSSNLWATSLSGAVRHWDGSVWTVVFTAPRALTDIHGFAVDDIFVVGDAGEARRYDGSTWAVMNPKTNNNLEAVWGASPSEVYAVGAGGVISRFGGATWLLQSSPTSSYLNSVWGDGAGTVYAVGEGGTIVADDGSGWALQRTGTGIFDNVWGTDPDNVFASGETGFLLHYNGYGWAPMETPTTLPLYAAAGTARDDVTLFGWFGTVMHYLGAQVTPASTTPASTESVFGFAPDEVYAAGAQVLRWNGGAWVAQSTATAGFHDVWGSSASDVFAVGSAGVEHFDGTGWTPQAVPGSPNLYSVWGLGPTDVFAVGESGTVVHYDGAWSEMSTSTSSWLWAVWAAAPDDAWAVGDWGVVLHYDGVDWTEVIVPTFESVNGVWGSGANDVFAVGDDGVILHYDGATWSAMTSHAVTKLTDVFGRAPDDVFAVGENGTLLHYDGLSWAPVRTDTTQRLEGVWIGAETSWIVGEASTAEIVHRTCMPVEIDCSNRWDDDCDGALNCADADCAGDAYCTAGGACRPATPIGCGDLLAGTVATSPSLIETYGCGAGGRDSQEAAFAFTAATAGTVQVAVTSAELDVFVLPAQNGACDPAGCLDTDPAAVSFSAAAGATYYFVVDGQQPLATAAFSIEVTCP